MLVATVQAAEVPPSAAFGPVPSERQILRGRMQFYAFLHFSVNALNLSLLALCGGLLAKKTDTERIITMLATGWDPFADYVATNSGQKIRFHPGVNEGVKTFEPSNLCQIRKIFLFVHSHSGERELEPAYQS
jgi:hypothetical protein